MLKNILNDFPYTSEYLCNKLSITRQWLSFMRKNPLILHDEVNLIKDKDYKVTKVGKKIKIRYSKTALSKLTRRKDIKIYK